MKRGGPLRRLTPMKRTAMNRRSKSGSSSDFTEVTKGIIRIRSMGICEMPDCFAKATHFHHRLRRSHGGQGTVENGMHLCGRCHGYVHDHPTESYERGWLIRSGGD